MAEFDVDDIDGDEAMLGLFGGMGATRADRLHGRLLFWESQLLHRLVSVPARLKAPGAQRHIFEGVLQRYMMMQTSRLFIRETCAKQTGGLSPYTATALDIHLNAYYLNLTGALDNLAWAVTYEVPLIKQISEEGPRNSQEFAKLVGKRFLEQLASKGFPEAAKALESLKGWVDTVKALRDPAAHRLPLRFITALIPADRRAEYEDLKARQADALLREDFDERRRLQEQERRLATFLPAMAAPAPDGNGLRIVPNQILADQEQFVRVTNHVLSEVLDRSTAEPAVPGTAR